MKSTQAAVTIALTILYVGLAWVLSGMVPILGWFFAPAFVMIGAGFLSYLVQSILPVPWVNARVYGPPPRSVRLSWRSTFFLPVLSPWLVFLGRVAEVSVQWGIGWVRNIAIAVPAAVLATVVLWITLRSKREVHLLREGEVASAFVHGRYSDETFDGVDYQFVAADGTTMGGRAEDRGYRVAVGSTVPVFYDASNPRKHLIASSSWFEAGS